jgi:hypothetical protein
MRLVMHRLKTVLSLRKSEHELQLAKSHKIGNIE